MRFDIVSITWSYRGIDRSIEVHDFLTKDTKSNYKKLLDQYFNFLDDTCNPKKSYSYDLEQFKLLLSYYKFFRKEKVNCEIIAFSYSPLENLFGYHLEFLGIDVVCDLAESLIKDRSEDDRIKSCLNRNGLLDNVENIAFVLENSITGKLDWRSCFVYKVLISD